MTLHYFIPSSLNYSNLKAERAVKTRQARARKKKRAMVTELTFEQLKAQMIERAGHPGMPSLSSIPNLTSALEAFVRQQGLVLACHVGTTFRVSFYKLRTQHLASLSAEGRSKNYIANRKHLLARWHRLVVTLDREAAAITGEGSPLQKALLELVAGGVKMKALARSTGVPLASLLRWKAGATPRMGSGVHLTKIERYLGMTPGSLTSLVPSLRRSETAQGQSNDSDGVQIAYRSRLSKLSRDRYALKPGDASEKFRSEWESLVRFKANGPSVMGLLTGEASDRPTWRLHAKEQSRWRGHDWVDTLDGRWCPTAALWFEQIGQFFGWLQLDRGRGGLNWEPERAQTLANLCDKECLLRFADWRVDRSGGLINAGSTALLSIAVVMCHPVHGFLPNRPEIGLSRGFELNDWRERCAEALKYARAATRRLKSHAKSSRNSFEPIAAVLALDNPLDAVADAVRRMDADKPELGSASEALWARDRLLFTLAASNPLRARNLRELTWRQDNTGQLRRDAGGRWRIVIGREHFKNHCGAAKDRDYNMAVQESVWPLIDRYVREYRPRIVMPGCDLVFVSRRVRDKEWSGLNRRFEQLAGRYLHGCPGVGPHAIRHIVATTLIKRTGNVIAAALVLHDREETVRQHYAHLISDDGAKWLSEVAGDAFQRM